MGTLKRNGLLEIMKLVRFDLGSRFDKISNSAKIK